MVIERGCFFPGLDDFVESQHSADLYSRNLLLGSVVADFIALGFGQDAEERRVAICRPVPESRAADKNGHPGKKRIEEIEGSNTRDTNEVRQRALYTQISERLMQTLEDSVRSDPCCLMVCHKALLQVATNF